MFSFFILCPGLVVYVQLYWCMSSFIGICPGVYVYVHVYDNLSRFSSIFLYLGNICPGLSLTVQALVVYVQLL